MMQSCNNQSSPNQACCDVLGELLSPQFFKALGDPNRIAILINLARRCVPMTVTEVAKCCPVDISVVSRHLAILRDAGILDVVKQGKQVFYSVRYTTLTTMLRRIADSIEACCPTTEAGVQRKEFADE